MIYPRNKIIKIIRKNDISRTNNVHNNKFQLNNKKKKGWLVLVNETRQ